MKRIPLIIALFLTTHLSFSQKNWFSVYTDSASLVQDGGTITKAFIADIKKIKPGIALDVTTILNTTPYLIYFDGEGKVKTANLPIWAQVIPQQQQFFYEVAGGEAAGKAAFGLFFNGFYLPHELGHGVDQLVRNNLKGSYEEEYFANTVSMLWWRKQGREKDLKACYDAAKTMFAKLPNPVPAGMTIEAYFGKNYEEASQNPYVYGYMQFKQFIQIYEDKQLPDFNGFMQKYFADHQKK
jgi:hypothetical protein